MRRDPPTPSTRTPSGRPRHWARTQGHSRRRATATCSRAMTERGRRDQPAGRNDRGRAAQAAVHRRI
eukprot:8744449-Pyramimonas_sp.AAC.1